MRGFQKHARQIISANDPIQSSEYFTSTSERDMSACLNDRTRKRLASRVYKTEKEKGQKVHGPRLIETPITIRLRNNCLCRR